MASALPSVHLSTKIRDLIRAADIGILTTSSSRLAVATSSARKAEWDENGAICFTGAVDTSGEFFRKKVKLFYCNPATADYVSIYGEAEVEVDQPVSGLWHSLLRFFSPSRSTQSDLKIRRVTPTEAYLWDTQTSRMISVYGKEQEQPLPKIVSNRLCGEVIL